MFAAQICGLNILKCDMSCWYSISVSDELSNMKSLVYKKKIFTPVITVELAVNLVF